MRIQRQHGPFVFESGLIMTVNGTPSRRWTMSYGEKPIAEKVVPGADIVLADLFQAFEGERAAFICRRHRAPAPRVDPLADGYRARLVESTPVTGSQGRTLGEFLALAPITGLQRGLINDRFATWLVTDRGVMPMAAVEFANLKDAHAALADALTDSAAQPEPAMPHAWVADLLPDDVLAQDPAQWRAPTSWEIRHVVGEGSFTGVTGAQAAALVGVTPQNFRKYTARDGASTRQKMSFAMWHLLLHKLGVQAA